MKNVVTATWEFTYAERLLLQMTATIQMAKALNDDSPLIRPRALASLACDIANAFGEEARNREWIIEADVKADAPDKSPFDVLFQAVRPAPPAPKLCHCAKGQCNAAMKTAEEECRFAR